jgi:hypothetical protein
VGGRHAAERRLALDIDVVLVVVDVELGSGGVLDAPDDDGGDLDRVAEQVVDLDLAAVEVARAQRERVLDGERVRRSVTVHCGAVGTAASGPAAATDSASRRVYSMIARRTSSAFSSVIGICPIRSPAVL